MEQGRQGAKTPPVRGVDSVRSVRQPTMARACTSMQTDAGSPKDKPSMVPELAAGIDGSKSFWQRAADLA
jgi:hypothetical protein